MTFNTQSPEHSPLSSKQKSTLRLIDELLKEFGEDNRRFTQHELYNVTKHTMDALVEKEYLDCEQFVISAIDPVGVLYYRRVKKMEEHT